MLPKLAADACLRGKCVVKYRGMENKFYYNQMSRDEKAVYEAMLSGFASSDAVIRAPLLPGKVIGDVFFRLRLDHPEIFYVTGCGFRWVQGAAYAELLPEYMFEKQKIPEHRRALETRLEKLVRPVSDKTAEEKELFIHGFICESVRYDKLKKCYSHEIIGPLQNGVGVCEGMAKTVKLMCDRLGIDCVIAVSEPDPDGGRYLHAWNVIRLGKSWYHLDATFDNTLTRGGEIRYDYFNLCDKQIFRDHRTLRYPVPECADSGGFYYREHGLSFTKPEELPGRVSQAIRKKKDGLTFHWRGGYLTRDKLVELAQIINAEAAKRGRGVLYSVNWAQAVIRLVFTDPGAALCIESEDAETMEGEI